MTPFPRSLFVLTALLGAPTGPTWAETIVWGGTVKISSGGWGRMVRLGEFTWLAVSTAFPSGEPSKLRIYRSTNNARTWTQLAEVVEAGRNFDNGHLAVLPNGSILLTGRSLIDGESYRLPVYRSVDGGRIWTPLSNIDSNEGSPGSLHGKGLWEPFLHVLSGGRVAALYSSEKHDGYSQVISQKVSSDGGATWGAEVWAAAEPGGGSLRPGMPVIARMSDSRYLLVYEVVGLGNADVHRKISTDGVTWEEGLGRRIPGQHCGPFILSVTDGRLFVSSCENQISLSEDLGESWVRVDPPAWDLGFAFSWPALYEVGGAELGAMVTSGGVQLRFGALRPPASWPESVRDAFDGEDGLEWTQYGGAFELDGGRCLLANEGSYGKALTGSVFWSDGMLEADVRLETAGDAGLMFRATDPDTTGPDAARGYYAGLDAGGVVVLGRMEDAWTELARASMDIRLNVWYRLRVEMRGDLIRVYANDLSSPRIVHRDASFVRGQIGVRAFQCDARFDNLFFTSGVPFRRGDSNGDGDFDLSDAVSILSALFLGTPMGECPDSLDANDDSLLDMSDAIRVLRWLFDVGAPPPEPLDACGVDPTPDDIPCRAFDPCM